MTTHNNILIQLGFSSSFENYLKETQLHDWEIARITSEHKERYRLVNHNGEFEGEVIGTLRFTAQNREDFPVVGDWVTITKYDDAKVFIHHILKRTNILKRQAVGKAATAQPIAANVDYAFVVESVNRDFSINRFQRYITLCFEARISPILVLNKADLIDTNILRELVEEVNNRIPDVPVITTSCLSQSGISDLQELILSGKTYCFLGSSGVGKSSLINLLSGSVVMETGVIGSGTQRGKHVTSHRELIILPRGGVLIDNPGMREVGITNAESGLGTTFVDITSLAKQCKYTDCTHQHEDGCAVLEALENGEIDRDSYNNFLKMQREAQHYSYTEAEKRQKGKDFAKMVKQVKKRKPWKY